jgi:excinuclease ABC subunit A
VLYARVGRPHCLKCSREIQRVSKDEILNFILEKVGALKLEQKKKGKIMIFAPVVRGRKGEYYQLLYDMLSKGYEKVRIDAKMRSLRSQIILAKNKKHHIDVLVDEIALGSAEDELKNRLSEAIELALDEADGVVSYEFALPNFPKENLGGLMSSKFSCPYDGFSFPEIEPRLFSFNSPYGACEACHGLGTKHFFGTDLCEACKGARLRKEALNVFITGLSGQASKNIREITSLSIEEAAEFFNQLKLKPKDREIAAPLIKEIRDRLQFMLSVGIGYITLDRRVNTLSGGEAQRIRLASQLGSRLVGALYCLDEPTIGLHPRDNGRLIKTLQSLRDLGNTVIVVEHDEDTIFSSDYLVDIGPRAGIHGGEVVVADELEKLLDKKYLPKKPSLTLDYLREEKKIEVPKKRRTASKGRLKIRNGNIFNVKNLNLDIPLGRFICLTGLSGSGKSTLLYEILHKNLQARFDRRYRSNQTFNCKSFLGSEYLSRAILIDQSPIGRTSRSNPATYTGAFSHIRDLFASTSEARLRGYKSSRFSFNVKGGRCESCQGHGTVAVEMHFLPTVYVECDICGGKRFDKETLEVKYKKKNIYEVLEMTVEEAIDFFSDIPAVYDRLKTLSDVGLGYLEIGQSSTTLSGGEAQRVKISSELYRPFAEKTIYLLDEPTVGLHYEDVKNLLMILNRLVDRGNTVIVIEHNMDVVKSADYMIDMGPEGGGRGGNVVAKGTPEEVARIKDSHTAFYLRKWLKK